MEKNLFSKSNKEKRINRKIKFHYDDKGRKIYDVSDINLPQPPEKIENKNEIRKPKEELKYLKKRNEIELNDNLEVENKDISTIYHCKICNCSLKDNQAYYDHINGKRHNQMLGMNMKVEKVGVEKVREKLLNLKRKNENPLITKQDLKRIKLEKGKELEEIANNDEEKK